MARRRALACALVVAAASALAPPLALPQVELYLDLRMTIRRPLDAISTINQSPSGVIMWESASAPAHDPELDGLNVLAVDPGSRNIDGLAAVRPVAGGPEVSLFEPPFDPDQVISACSPGHTVLVDSDAAVWTDETLPLVEVLAAAAAGSARVLVSLYDKAMLSACCEKLVLGSLTGSGLVSLGGGEDAPGEPGSIGVALPPDPSLWKLAKTYASG
jgi:hypothetical protein